MKFDIRTLLETLALIVFSSDCFLCDFREKMAFFTRAKTSIPDLPADDV